MVWIPRIKNKNQETVLDIIPPQDMELRALIRKHQAQASVSKRDVASGKHASFPPSVDWHETVVYRRRKWWNWLWIRFWGRLTGPERLRVLRCSYSQDNILRFCEAIIIYSLYYDQPWSRPHANTGLCCSLASHYSSCSKSTAMW